MGGVVSSSKHAQIKGGEYNMSEKKGIAAGVKDNSRSHKPVPARVKKAKYGFHKKDLSKTKTY